MMIAALFAVWVIVPFWINDDPTIAPANTAPTSSFLAIERPEKSGPDITHDLKQDSELYKTV